jgi:aquaporin Z|tara:strand:- start:875 stop:1135 length:261 start_codon:yes stop_codon:yes gene_type:complete
MNKYLVEFVGTLFFLFVILVSGEAIPIGLALILAIMLGGKISGGHFNPAVSVMMFLNKKIQAQDLLFYVLAQLLGGAVALQLYKVI